MSDPDNVLGQYIAPGGLQTNLPVSATKDRSLAMTRYGMAYRELVRQSMMWSTMATSAVAALVVRPSTVAALELWNGYPAGGPSMVIDRLFTQWLVSTAAAASAGIWAQVTAVKTAPSSASLAIVGAHGTAYGGSVVNAVGTTVVANGWFPFGPSVGGPGTATPGGSWDAVLDGRLIVPPGCSLCVHVVGSLVGDTFCSGASWTEEQLDVVFP